MEGKAGRVEGREEEGWEEGRKRKRKEGGRNLKSSDPEAECTHFI